MKNKIFITAVLLLTFVSFMRAETGTGKVRNDRTANTAFTGARPPVDRTITDGISKVGKVSKVRGTRGLQKTAPTNDQGNCAYAVFDSTTGTLTFTYQHEKPSEGEVFVVGETEFVEPEVGESRYVPKWLGDFSYDSSNNSIYFSNSENIRKVVFDPSFAEARPTSTGSWFYRCTNLIEIEGIEYLNTSEVTDMGWMFWGCNSLTSLDVSNFNTSKVWRMYSMFCNCESLTTLDVSNFDTGNVTEMPCMFYGCSRLTSIDVSHFNTANVTDMRVMFCDCSSLTSLDVSDFNTENVTNMSGMFDGCNSLESLDLSNFNTANVTDMTGMFYGCSSLESLEINNFNTQNVTDMRAMFRDCSSLTTLNVSNFNTENVTNMESLFHYCSSLTTIDVSHFDTSNVTDMGWMFWGCNSLTSLDVSNFNTSKVWRMYSMFCNCESLTTLDVSNFDTGNVTEMPYMFHGCTNLTFIDVSNFNTENVTDMNCLFYECFNLTTIDVSHFDTSNVTDMGWLFYECNSLTSIDVSNFNTSKVWRMYSMFCGCNNLTALDVSNFDTGNVTEMPFMFCECSSLTSINLPTDMTSIGDFAFQYCSSLTYITIPASITSFGSEPFYGCNSLESVTSLIEEPSSIDNYVFNTSDFGLPFATLFVPQGTVETYQMTLGWNQFTKIVEIGTELTISDGDIFTAEIAEGVTMLFRIISIDEKTCQVGAGNNSRAVIGAEGQLTIPSEVDGYKVTSIGNNAFSNYDVLTNITIPETVVSIGNQAFAYCDNLDSLIVKTNTPCEINNIVEDEKFSYLKVFVPVGTKEQYREANGWSNFRYIMEEGEEIKYADGDVFRVTTEDGDKVVYKIISIEDKTCQIGDGNDTAINRSIRGEFLIPDNVNGFTVTSIGDHAFQYCNNLTSIDIPANVTSIGNDAFRNCYNLTSIDIPESVTSIGNDAFRNCYNLTSINIPANVTSIGNYVFYYCEDLTSINIPANVTSIGDYAFAGCYNLTSITIPASVTSIANNAFSWCSVLKEVHISDLAAWCAISFGSSNANPLTEAGHLYLNGDEITELTIPSSVTSIKNYAFRGCSGLTSVTIPNSVTSIGDEAFTDCSNLDSLILKSNTPFEIDAIVEDEAYSYLKVIVPVGTKELYRETNGWSNFRYILEEGEEIELADGDVFRVTTEEGTKVTYKIISIEDKTCQIGDGYSSAINYETEGVFVIPHNINDFTVISIGDYAFENCYNLTSITIPADVTTIGDVAFIYCGSLTSITIPASVTTIGEAVLIGCGNLNAITVENGNSVYDSRNDCNAIIETATNTLISGCMNTTIPNDVTTIGMNAFGQCYGLQEITIPSSVTSIGEYAFAYCNNLTSVTVERKVPVAIESNTFAIGYYSENERTLYVPASSLDVYTSTTGWDVFDDYIGYDKPDLTIDESGLRTFCSDIDLDFSGVEGISAYIATAVNLTAGTVMMTPITEVPAGTGVYVVGTPGSYEIPYAKTSAYSMNLLKGNVVSNIVNPQEGNHINYQLTMDGSIGFTPILSAQTMNANTAYLQVPSSLVGNPEEAAKLTIVFSEEATTVNIEKKETLKLSDLSYTLPSEKSVYNGREFYATVDDAEDIGTIHIYYTDAYGNKTEQRPIATGTYTISFEIEGSDTYYATTFPNVLTFTIKKQLSLDDLRYTLPDEEIIYDGYEHYATISNAYNFSPIYIYYTNSKGYKTTQRPVNPDTYSISFEKEESDQYYSSSFDVGEFTIKLLLATEELNMLKTAYEQMENTNRWYNKWTFNENDPTKSVIPGVIVKDEHITAINLGGNRLSGNFPTALLRLPYLTTLSLYSNPGLSGDLGQQMTAYMEQNPDATFALKELNINSCGFSGNIGAFAQHLTNLTSLSASYNYFDEVIPMISSKVKSLDLGYQSIKRVLEFDLKQLTPEVFTEKMPSIILYNHQAQSYEPSQLNLSCSTTYDNWSMTMRYQNGQLTIPSASSQNTYYGTSGDILNVQAYNGNTTLPAQNSTFQFALSFDTGDSNFDGAINILDLQTVINYMFEEYNSKPFNFTAVNLWEDDIINVQDAVCLVNILLEADVTSEQEARLSDRATLASPIYSANSYISEGQLVINSTVPVSAFDIVIESDCQVEISDDLRLAGFSCMTKRVGKKMHLVGYSLSGATLPVGMTSICRLSRGTLAYVMLSDSDAQEISCVIDAPTSMRSNRLEDSSSEVYRLPIGARRSIVIDADGRKTIKKDK